MATPSDLRAWPRLGVDLSRAFRSSLPVDRDRAGLALVERALDGRDPWVDCGVGSAVPDIERRAAAALARSPRGGSAFVSTTLGGEPRTEGARAAEGRPGPGRLRSLFEGPPEDWPKSLEEAVDRATRRLARTRLSLAWIDGVDTVGLRSPAVRRVLEEMQEEGGALDSWGVRLAVIPANLDARQRALGLRPPFLAFPLHLLNAGEGMLMAREGHAEGTRVVATDPFADGLLDGSWFSPAGAISMNGPGGPPSWGQLRERFEPVRRLGYLTADRRRTLPQAALRFLWGSPEISSVLVAPRDSRELNAASGAWQAPDLTDSERRRVLLGPVAPEDDERRAAQIGGPTKRSS